MIEIRDTIILDAPPETVWVWLEALPDHYLQWHPDHVSCHWSSGSSLETGARMEVEERLHGKLHRLTMTLTTVEPGLSVRYRIAPGMSGSFKLEGLDGRTRFTASLYVGLDAPLIGRVVDIALRLLMRRRLEAFRAHQLEEGQNLQRLFAREPNG
jgi:uncharacterized protein YndB with AHSA1/START domain